MAQFDVYKNLSKISGSTIPYLLDVQANFLEGLNSRMIVPLVLHAKLKSPIRNLNPQFEIENKQFIMSTTEMTSVSLKILGEKIISLADQRTKIIAALDFLFIGF